MYRFVRAAAAILIGSLFAISVAAATVAQQQPQPVSSGVDPALPSGSAAVNLIAIVAGFASVLAGQIFQAYRESRNRRWDLQDRKAAREEMRQHAETQRYETYQTAVELAKVSSLNREHLLEAIDKNRQLAETAATQAVDAYKAANDYNAKLENLHKQLLHYAAGTTEKEK